MNITGWTKKLSPHPEIHSTMLMLLCSVAVTLKTGGSNIISIINQIKIKLFSIFWTIRKRGVGSQGPPWFCFNLEFKLFLVTIVITVTQQKNIEMVKTKDKCFDIKIFSYPRSGLCESEYFMFVK